MDDDDMGLIGCIADDFTGATDVASVLASVGRRAVVVFDIDRVTDAALADADAIVVALKSRTAPVGDAVAASHRALAWLRDRRAGTFYVKYCSTFDSTPQGNIGPVIDAALADLELAVALVAPSYPANGRTVYQGHLFVHDQLLDESPMRHHPLTPMLDSSLERLLRPQTALPIEHLRLAAVRSGAEAVAEALSDRGDGPVIVIADAVDDADLRLLARSAGPHVLLTGGAGLALGLDAEPGRRPAPATVSGAGERLVLSGSASAATREQVAHARGRIAHRKLDLSRARADAPAYAREIADWVAGCWRARPGEPVLVYATDTLDDLGDGADREAAAASIEDVLGGVARIAADGALGALIVAGGETSGRVVQDLAVASLEVGPAIAPGVVWARAQAPSGSLAIALKSGNFGEADMFTTAWDKMS